MPGPVVARPTENPLTRVMRSLGLSMPPPTGNLPALPSKVGPGTPGYDPTTLANRIANPSVMEPWWMKGVRAGADVANRAIDTGTGFLLGPDDSGTSNRNMGALLAAAAPFLAPLMMRVPTEAPEALTRRLASSWGETEAPPPVTEAVENLARRFPRMLSHIEQVGPLPPTAAKGTLATFTAAEDGVPRIGSIQVDPSLSASAIQDALVHELTHGGQALRAADRGLEFQPIYASSRQQHGYYNSPFEVRARVAENNQSLRDTGVFTDPRQRLETARMWAGDKTLPGPDTVYSTGPTAKMEGLSAQAGMGTAPLEIVPASPEQFAAGVGSLNKRARAMTSVYAPEELAQMQLYMVNGKNAGYAIKNGDELVNVFNNGGLDTFGRGDEIVSDAVRRGARRLDCFDGMLVKFYEKNGFRVVRREPNWTPGEPDVVFMEWHGGPQSAPAGVAGAAR